MSAPVPELPIDEEALVEEPLLPEAAAALHGPWHCRGLAVIAATVVGLALGAYLGTWRVRTGRATVSPELLSSAAVQLHEVRDRALLKVHDVLKELDNLECTADWMGMDFCGGPDAEESVMCKQTCLRTYQRLVATCPADHPYAKAAAERLADCDEGSLQAESMEGKLDTQEDLDNEQARVCVPKLFKFVIQCGVHDRKNYPQDVLCSDECQDALEEVREKCEDAYPLMPELEELSNVCRGCSRAIVELHNPKSFVGKSCGTELRAWHVENACEENCHPHVCDLMHRCDLDTDLEVPGVSQAQLENILTQLSLSTAECPCE